jgi:hypothetical protein
LQVVAVAVQAVVEILTAAQAAVLVDLEFSHRSL